MRNTYFTWGVPFNAKIVVFQTYEWKFKENIAQNITFEGS